MSEREIEIADEPGGGPEPPADGAGPYRNLWGPLVVVPALIVMVLVVVFALFGAIAGEESTPAENIDRLLHGGANERTQAAFNLVRQALEDMEAQAAGAPPSWHVDASLLPQLERAWEDTRDVETTGEVTIPLALAVLMAQLDDPRGVERLAELTQLSESVDPDGQYRGFAGFAIGSLGERLDEADRKAAARALIALMDEPDPFLRSVGVISLQTIDTPEAHDALRRTLGDASLELRGNAALSLARMGDPAGADVLRELLASGTYDKERERDSTKWTRARDVSVSRVKALTALAELGLAPPTAELERLLEEEDDPELRNLVRTLLRDGA